MCCLGHKGFEKCGAYVDTLDQIVKNRGKTVFLLGIFRQQPGSCLVDIFIAALEEIENISHCIGNS